MNDEHEYICPRCKEWSLKSQSKYILACPKCGFKQLSANAYIVAKNVILYMTFGFFFLLLGSHLSGRWSMREGKMIFVGYAVGSWVNAYALKKVRLSESGLGVTICGIVCVFIQLVILVLAVKYLW